jgi:DNA-binding NarL/FixJ family response regulator
VLFLVVEDDPLVARAIARRLRREGQVDVAGTLREGAATLGAGKYDGITVDLRLPDGCGLDLLSEAKRGSPALVITGGLNAEYLRRAHAVGAHCVLKPVQAEELSTFVARARAARGSRAERIRMQVTRWSTRLALTEAEAEVLRLRAEGRSRAAVARARGVSSETIDKQVKALVKKAGCASLDEAVAQLLREIVGAD